MAAMKMTRISTPTKAAIPMISAQFMSSGAGTDSGFSGSTGATLEISSLIF